VLAGSTAAIKSITFFNGKKPVATVRRGAAGLYGTTWRRGSAKGKFMLRAVVTDAKGRTAEAQRVARGCS